MGDAVTVAAPRTSPPMPRAEFARRGAHLAVGGLAYLLPAIGWTATFALTCTSIVANRYLLPHLPVLRRVRDVERGDRGVWTYPLGVGVLLLVFRDAPALAQAGWLALAVGDGLAPFVARVVGGPAWPWRRDKRVAVSLISGLLAAGAILPVAPWPAALAAGLCGAVADGLPARVEDNLAWPWLAGFGAWAASSPA